MEQKFVPHCRMTQIAIVLGQIFIRMADAKAHSLGSL